MTYKHKYSALFVLLGLLACVGCADQDPAQSDTVDPDKSVAAFLLSNIPAYPGSKANLLIYPSFIAANTTLDDVRIKCRHLNQIGDLQYTDNGVYSQELVSDGVPWSGRCTVQINGQTIKSLPRITARSLCERPSPNDERAEFYQLAATFSPVIYQDIGRWAEGDFIAPFDYDGNWIGNDNWENLTEQPPEAEVYYSIVETETHYFLNYSIFHPVRYGTFIENTTESHENSMTGLLVVLEKTGFGPKFILLETYFEGGFLIYSDDPKVSANREKIYSNINFEDNSHPVVFIESGKHGTLIDLPFVFGEFTGNRDSDFPGGDGIVYRFKGKAESPKSTNDRDVGYELTPILNTLWTARHNVGDGGTYDQPYMFATGCELPGNFDGDTYRKDASAPPWGWDDIDDGDVRKGEWFLLPAHTIASHVKVKGDFSLHYVYNPFLGIR